MEASALAASQGDRWHSKFWIFFVQGLRRLRVNHCGLGLAPGWERQGRPKGGREEAGATGAGPFGLRLGGLLGLLDSPAKQMAAAMTVTTPRGSAPTEHDTAGVLQVTEAEVRGLSVSRLRLFIFMLQGHVPMKSGNVSFADRAIRILSAGNTPFFAAHWEMLKGLPPTARHDPVMFRQLKDSADEAIRAAASPLRAQFVPTPPPAASEAGSACGEDDWHSVEGPPSDL